ncbi:MAG TPA: CCA tRNA nucleotidyltransferase, partial [Actinomycetota bacterium]|nr:CCA tRNA nucleotidyltransferase [Actinomycetota bacterium]
MSDPSISDLVTLPHDAEALGAVFERAGRELYLVGGSVRDALRGVRGGDLDFATDARPEEVVRLLQGWAQHRYLKGIRYGTVGARRGDLEVEITTFREEVYRDDSRHPRVTFAKDVETDLSRRDFTINAMAVRVPDRTFVDPFRGLLDLGKKVLRTPLEPAVSFGDDPLRMLRAARFVSTLDVTPVPEVIESVTEMRERLGIVS